MTKCSVIEEEFDIDIERDTLLSQFKEIEKSERVAVDDWRK